MRTATFEPRKIVSSVLNIMLDVYEHDRQASFFFIGAEDEKDVAGKSTRRFNFYADFVLSVISDKFFWHFRVDALSLYVLVNKESVDDAESLVNRIIRQVEAAMSV